MWIKPKQLERRSRRDKTKFSDLAKRGYKDTCDTETEERLEAAHKIGWRERMCKDNLTKYTIFENAIMICNTLKSIK